MNKSQFFLVKSVKLDFVNEKPPEIHDETSKKDLLGPEKPQSLVFVYFDNWS